MLVPLSWLRDFAPFGDDLAALRAALDDLGLVVEGTEIVGEGLDDVVVARVVEIAAIKGADRIRRVVVEAGDAGHVGGGRRPDGDVAATSNSVEVVCGAWNFSEGDLVPLARVGAVLPGGFEIAQRRMRGVTSNGMICSGRELRLSDDHEGILVLDPASGAAVGQPLMEALGLERDVVFDVTVEGERPDAWSIAGVARSLAARLGLPYRPGPVKPPATSGPPTGDLTSLVVESADLCPRFTVRVLTGVKVGPSPRWISRRLQMAGMRPINNVVDASNYVMLELGQPTHPYDLDHLNGGGLRVRQARPGERLVTLDGMERHLGVPGPALGDTGEDCLICDAADEPVGIAGIMGGQSSEISDRTQRVLLETAYFAPSTITRTATRLALRTEASARFEQGVDPAGLVRAADRLIGLLVGQGAVGAVAPEGLDAVGDVPQPWELTVPASYVNGLLGTELDATTMAATLEPLGFGVSVEGQGSRATLTVTVPTSRPDVRPAPFGRADVVEEVARLHGYSRIPRRQAVWPQPGRLSDRQRRRRQLRQVLVGLGGLEAWTPSMVRPEAHQRIGLSGPDVELENPQQSDQTVLRRSLLPGLLDALSRNAAHREGALRLFEVGTVFAHPDDTETATVDRRGDTRAGAQDLPMERELAAILLALEGDDTRTAVASWQVVEEAFRVPEAHLVVPAGDLLGDQPLGPIPGLHPTRSAWIVMGSQVLGAVGEIDPALVEQVFGSDAPGRVGEARRVGWLELDLDVLAVHAGLGSAEPARPVSRYPSSDVDLAFAVPDEVPVWRVEQTIRRAGGELLESLRLFDVFRSEALGPGRRSLAFRLRFCALDRTLTDGEVGGQRQAVIDAVARAHQGELRG